MIIKRQLEKYNVVWTTPSADSKGSMPLGNGDIGINLWVEEDGDLLMYISKTDSWNEIGRLLKLGRIRIKFSPNPYKKDAPFKQTLKLQHGEIEIAAGKEHERIALLIWVDANRPVIQIEAIGERKFEIQAIVELWRDSERVVANIDKHLDPWGMNGAPYPVKEYPDTVLPNIRNRIIWFHRNPTSIWSENLELQGLSEFKEHSSDPLINRTFGCVMEGAGVSPVNDVTLKSDKMEKSFHISIYPYTGQAATVEDWQSDIREQITKINCVDIENARISHRNWWKEFWNRSWIFVSGTEDADIINQGYVLQRFINSGGGRGKYAIKFNGSIFTFECTEYGPDYRQWGGGYWFQNTRFPYWPMMASGDFDLMKPLFKMYMDALPLARERTKIFFKHDGAYFPETIHFWGTYTNWDYGWDRSEKDVSEIDSNWIKRHFNGNLELLAIAIDYYNHTQDESFARSVLIPYAAEILSFFGNHYKLDKRDYLHLEPSQAIETYWDTVNPMPDISGLHWCLSNLLALDKNLIGSDLYEVWQCLQKEIPPIPMKEEDGEKYLLPAKQFDKWTNEENPQLYAVFPFRIFGIGKTDIDIARRSYFNRIFRGHKGWQQDDIQAALLGLTDETREFIKERFKNINPEYRFPAFWGPNYDWVPDQCHGNAALITLQSMLMQCDNGKIILFPAWPKEWDVEFKLHAHRNTVVEVSYVSGKVRYLKVTPEDREKDMVIS